MSLRPSKVQPGSSLLPTAATARGTLAAASKLKRPLSQSNLNATDVKKLRSDATKSMGSSLGTGRTTPSRAAPRNPASGTTGRTTPSAKPAGGLGLTRSLSASSGVGRTTPGARPGLAGRMTARGAPQWSQKEICEKLAALEKQMNENSQAAKEQTEQLTHEKQALTAESTRYREDLQERIEEIGSLKRDKMNLTNQVEELQADLGRLKSRYESKSIELETLEKSYQMLDAEHRSFRRDMSVKEAENKRLEGLLENERNETKRLTVELAASHQERDAAKARMRENETRLRYIHNQMLELKGNIRVFARVRPITEDEGEPAVSTAPEETLTVAKPNAKPGGKPTPVPFQFDRVLGADVGQVDVFEEVEQLVVSALDGYNVCIFAYGQTGSGKTYTMEGPPGLDFEDESQSSQFGIIPRSLHRVFELTEERREFGWEYTLEASFLEIYNETIQDLLDKNKSKECTIRQTTDVRRGEVVFVENLVSISVKSVRQIAQLMEKARRNRSVAATKCNERSSRSHCVFQLHITARNSINEVHRESTLNLVDLAGSERVKESGAEGARFTETKNINSSLTQLSTVMMSLGNKASILHATHIPYRNSKLTHLLSTSLGGNSKTLMFVNVSPAAAHVNESLNSLKFAQKVNEVHIGPASKNNK
ncbi:kinesin protein KIFC1-like [Tropilaelaps mercedesae]|uniref:Kinesin-like protein n=1 Tax=Tropilaelaps mercedesae TaxID=418985 RepID=A0A1V9XSM9_9ACAR|nr:kinesin protein KIFC1-like [Tropilaelaps mercedesae]